SWGTAGSGTLMTWWKFWERDSTSGSPDYYEEGVALVGQELYHEALTSFRLALKSNPDDPATLEQMAVVYTHIGLPDDAERAYTRAIELRPRSPSAHYGLAFLQMKNGRRFEAEGHLRAFLEYARPDRVDDRQIAHARRTLERLGSGGDIRTGSRPSGDVV
ncbi:MAG: tetratricopeptide repeat protein, partial [Gemmatimonadota bacterium]|nr:tetratricopeptide repeat protein [Gemmatimonadota bacterium]